MYYDWFKTYAGGSQAREKLKDAACGKIRRKVAQDLKIPLHDADIIILMDDWYDTLKGYGQKVVEGAKDFYHNNK